MCKNKISRKFNVSKEFARKFGQAKFPCAFLAFGSIGRGAPTELSDVDLMVIFLDDFTDDVFSSVFLNTLPFEQDEMNPILAVDSFDISDLRTKTIDFLRFKGICASEKVELQFFPFSSIKKAVDFLGGDLVGGTKELDARNRMKTDNLERPTLTFDGEVAFFRKNQRILDGRNRIDFNEVGNKISEGKWIRGLTLGKLISPKILVNSIDFTAFVDEVVLRRLIDLLLQIFELYEYRDGRITGIKEIGLNCDILFKVLRSHKDYGSVYDFGAEEKVALERRFKEQVEFLLSQINNS